MERENSGRNTKDATRLEIWRGVGYRCSSITIYYTYLYIRMYSDMHVRGHFFIKKKTHYVHSFPSWAHGTSLRNLGGFKGTGTVNRPTPMYMTVRGPSADDLYERAK